MAVTDLVLAITGASGSPYGVRLLDVLLRAGRTVHLTISPAAVEVLRQELDRTIRLDRFELGDLLGPSAGPFPGRVSYHDYRDFRAGIASGSFLTGGMVVCPCSMGTVAAIAHGLSQNLIHRAADVHLKERRKLILVPRETPLHAVQLRNLAACAEAGAVVLPAMPAFYTRPRGLDDLVDFIVGRICDQLGVEHDLFKRWGGREMIINPDFVERLRCPLAPRLAGLTLADDRLVCQNCGLKFKIKDGLPNLIPEDAELPPGCGSLKQLPCQQKK